MDGKERGRQAESINSRCQCPMHLSYVRNKSGHKCDSWIESLTKYKKERQSTKEKKRSKGKNIGNTNI